MVFIGLLDCLAWTLGNRRDASDNHAKPERPTKRLFTQPADTTEPWHGIQQRLTKYDLRIHKPDDVVEHWLTDNGLQAMAGIESKQGNRGYCDALCANCLGLGVFRTHLNLDMLASNVFTVIQRADNRYSFVIYSVYHLSDDFQENGLAL